MRIYKRGYLLTAMAALCHCPPVHADPSVVNSNIADSSGVSTVSVKPPSFLPIWKLLNHDQKQQFVAGYIQGWKDAAKVTDIAISYVKENPKQAVSGLEKLKALYDLSDVHTDALVRGIDNFYSDPDNREAALSLAVTAARAAPPNPVVK